jgi:hypothetical protein
LLLSLRIHSLTIVVVVVAKVLVDEECRDYPDVHGKEKIEKRDDQKENRKWIFRTRQRHVMKHSFRPPLDRLSCRSSLSLSLAVSLAPEVSLAVSLAPSCVVASILQLSSSLPKSWWSAEDGECCQIAKTTRVCTARKKIEKTEDQEELQEMAISNMTASFHKTLIPAV